ncbi:MAG: TIM barrel protein [Steroidobacteraceae bacterium]
MPRFAANLSTLFTELPLLQRFGAAAAAGFEAVEMQDPFSERAPLIAEQLQLHQLQLVLFNSPLGTRPGDRGLAALPGRELDFWRTFETALDYARVLECPRIRVVCGHVGAMNRDAMEAVLIANLKRAARLAAASGISLLLEPLNPQDVPGYLLANTDSALTILDRVGHPNVRLQLDLYHCYMSEGDLGGHARRLLGRYDHVQFSNAPGRHEPGTGEIHYPYLFTLLDRLGYDGWVGCEYFPSSTTLASLAWAREWGIGSQPTKAPRRR